MDDGLASFPHVLILIVDDDVRSASLLGRMLQSEGYETEVANDGASAIARLTRDPAPDVLITERHLPHADGLAVARYARSRRAGMAIYFLTAHPQALAGTSGCAGEPIVLLSKPLDYAELVVRLAARPAGAKTVA